MLYTLNIYIILLKILLNKFTSKVHMKLFIEYLKHNSCHIRIIEVYSLSDFILVTAVVKIVRGTDSLCKVIYIEFFNSAKEFLKTIPLH